MNELATTLNETAARIPWGVIAVLLVAFWAEVFRQYNWGGPARPRQ